MKNNKCINKIINFIYFGNFIRNPFCNDLKNLLRYIPKNPIIIEAGAHTGSDTIRMHYAFKNAKIYAFEPEPNAYLKLNKKTYGYKNIFTYNAALGKEDGTKKLFISSNLTDASSSLLEQNKIHQDLHPNITLDNSIEVMVRTLDSWAQQENIDYIDFMWLDMQGGELDALKSGTNLLKKVKAIYTEVLLMPTYKNAPLYPEVKAWLEEKGFSIEIEREISDEQVNILFIKK